MTLSSGLRRLADVVDELERADVEVRDATIDSDSAGDRVDATVELSIAVEPAVQGTDITVDGTLEDPEGSVPDPDGSAEDEAGAADTGTGSTDVEPAPDSEPAAVSDAETNDDGVVECPEPDCAATFESEPGMKVHRTKVHRSAAENGEDGPPAYRDPEQLTSVYESEDTFPAMRDALDADVSAQTVRRHMIRHGIHDPVTGEASADESADEETPSVLTDGAALQDLVPADLSLPDDLRLGDLRDCVETADTLYDVQQRFDLDRESARELLAAFDLLELVHGRVATKHERDQSKDEIDRRIRANIADAPSA
ncbi:hypothetical protein [Halorientalis marina]|uniref:hypothetical protein n=1 Tax=Halorientalis marina TaxID=2931976 RepID=UPI001FF5E3BF|nr:hypothetical protein [Halorientalis marina]